MKDPVQSFDNIKNNYKRYFETAFKTKFQSIENERLDWLEKDKVLYREPWIEPAVGYQKSDKRIKDLTTGDLNLEPNQLETFKELVTLGLVPEDVTLFEHQLEMLQNAVNNNKDCVITSGTGSGKTEAFLLPLFAQLAKEVKSWERPNPQNKSPYADNWWVRTGGNNPLSAGDIVDKDTKRIKKEFLQRGDETRPSGMRALILYPMNALVEDQMSRLRTALDLNKPYEWFKSELNGNKVTFGRYNSSSPVAGDLAYYKPKSRSMNINQNKFSKLQKQLAEIEGHKSDVDEYIDKHKNELSDDYKDELRAFFPSLRGAELRSRFDMQETPPDIMITNTSMLNIMLMRDMESNIFEKTRQWLNGDDLPEEQREESKKDRVFHLIVDELHLYRGTAGTEIAYLLKLVIKRLGLYPGHPQLKILASSASLESEGEKSNDFFKDFFGFSRKDNSNKEFKIVEGKQAQVERVQGSNTLPLKPFADIATEYNSERFDATKALTDNQNFFEQLLESGQQITERFGIDNRVESLKDFYDVLINPAVELKQRLIQPCISSYEKTVVKTIPTFNKDKDNDVKSFFSAVFNAGEETDEEHLRDAAKGLMLVRSVLDTIDKNHTLPSFRMHYFFRNIEGFWASVDPEETFDGYSEDDGSRPVGKLYPQEKIRSDNGSKVLELLYCDNCGTVLLGGQKGKPSDENSLCQLLTVDPDIEGIPEKSPSKIVEKRMYQDYGVFWPIGNQELEESASEGWSQPLRTSARSNYTGHWVYASLNKYTGDIAFEPDEAGDKKYVTGYFFKIYSNKNTPADPDRQGDDESGEILGALPSVCPSCAIDHTRSQNKPSPVRGFRTGFSKTNQLFAKELAYQLDDPSLQEENKRRNARKLVVFSDSREDAAQTANGIERNHFTDLLRENLIKELNESVLPGYRILSKIEKDLDLEYERHNYEDLVEELEYLYEKSQKDKDSSNQWRRQEAEEAEQKLKKYKRKATFVSDLIRVEQSIKCAPLIKRLIRLGVNPGGPNIDLQYLGSYSTEWYKSFENIGGNNPQWRHGIDAQYQQEIENGLLRELGRLFFGNLFYSLEASGLGYLSADPEEDLGGYAADLNTHSENLHQIVNSLIRILGSKYKYQPSNTTNNNGMDLNTGQGVPPKARDYLQHAADKLHVEYEELRTRILRDIMCNQLDILNANGLKVRNLFIIAADEDDSAYISPNDGTPHLHWSFGICTQFPSKDNLNPGQIKQCKDLWERNYLAYNAAISKKESLRLHCEELSGQSDDPFKRQRHFRDVVLTSDDENRDEGHPRVKEIDLLSVTTTLEVGVDIGSLQAIMMANMPPQRFNYQQRVGRAGRSGQAFSVAFTFCRGRSHDEFYFNNPYRIMNDPPPTPFITLEQERIFKRLLAKEVLRQAFHSIKNLIEEDLSQLPSGQKKSSVHGEFGKVNNWVTYRPSIEEWINSNEEEVKKIVKSLDSTEVFTQEKQVELVKWATANPENEGLLKQTNDILSGNELAVEDISEKLAEGGVLPMYGMPTKVKNLYQGIRKDAIGNLEFETVDRPSELAIYEFAPGAQKTKDKAIHTSIGFTDTIVERYTQNQQGKRVTKPAPASENLFDDALTMVTCNSCQHTQTYRNEAPEKISECPYCGEVESLKKDNIKIPKAYRTDLTRGKDSQDNVDLNLSKPPIMAEIKDDPVTSDDNELNNCKSKLFDNDVTWKINDNGEKGFSGKIVHSTKTHRYNGFYFFLNYQWIYNDRSLLDGAGNNNLSSNSNDTFRIENPGDGELENITLADNKNTEILALEPGSVNSLVNLNMNDNGFPLRYGGVKSALYSGAFLIQRRMAEYLDVDPVEIEIAKVRNSEDQDGRTSVEIILTDELPNGSGFVRRLYYNLFNVAEEITNPEAEPRLSELKSKYLEYIHSEKHSENCDTACHDCLKVFRNMNYHGLLDWRLGMSFVRMLKDSDYSAGADGNFDYPELKDWHSITQNLVSQFVEGFSEQGFSKSNFESGIPTIYHERNNLFIPVIHPLWNCAVNNCSDLAFNPEQDDTKWLIEEMHKIKRHAQRQNGQIILLDHFNLSRNISKCYNEILNRFNQGVTS